jgi:septal ring factor EnvC (AmiA/AmiB activator)
MKQMPALIAALIMTAVLGLCMLGIGVSALANRNTAPLLTTPAAAAPGASDISTAGDQVKQLQARINQYQAREQQYQSQLNQLEQQLNQEGQTIQNFQQLLGALQAQGVILVQQDGTILIPRR